MSFGDSRNAWRWGDQNGRNETGGTRSSRAFSGSARLDVLQCSASIAQAGEVTGLTFLQEFMFSSERAPHVLRETHVVAGLGRLDGQWQLELEPWRQRESCVAFPCTHSMRFPCNSSSCRSQQRARGCLQSPCDSRVQSPKLRKFHSSSSDSSTLP